MLVNWPIGTQLIAVGPMLMTTQQYKGNNNG